MSRQLAQRAMAKVHKEGMAALTVEELEALIELTTRETKRPETASVAGLLLAALKHEREARGRRGVVKTAGAFGLAGLLVAFFGWLIWGAK